MTGSPEGDSYSVEERLLLAQNYSSRVMPPENFKLATTDFLHLKSDFATALGVFGADPARMSGQIFISYRRDDSAASTGRLYDRLSARLPNNHIFIDVSLDPGIDFVEAIETSVGSAIC